MSNPSPPKHTVLTALTEGGSMTPAAFERLVGVHKGRVLRSGTVMAVAAFDRPAHAQDCAAALQRASAEAGAAKEAGLCIGIAHDQDSAADAARSAGPGEIYLTASVVKALFIWRRYRLRPAADGQTFRMSVPARLGKTIRTEAGPRRKAIGWAMAGLMILIALIAVLTDGP